MTARPINAAPFRSGFVCVAGRPNVGKSTLVNRLVGHAVSITSPKPQTTRTRVLGVMRSPTPAAADTPAEQGAPVPDAPPPGDPWQAVLVDTPGIHEARDPLNVRLVRYALAALSDADLVLMLVEPLKGHVGRDLREDDQRVLEHVRKAGKPAFLVINKVDAATDGEVLETLKRYGELGRFAELVPVSARTGRNLDRLVALISARLPEGPPYFEPDQFTDQPQVHLLGELIRQEVFRRLQEEVPYSTAVRIEAIERKGKLNVVTGRILVERESQKGILIGKGGKMLKLIGTSARRRMEGMLGTSVYLELSVGVLDDWSRNPRHLAELGYPEE